MAIEEDEPILDAAGKVAYTGDQPHPYRTKTRFRKVDGVWEAIPPYPPEQRQAKRFSNPDERAAGRERAATKAKQERRAMAKIRKAIDKRQAIGDPSCRPSEAEAFPLMETLRREGREDHIAVVLRYRRLVALCEAEPLKGLDYGKSEGGEVVRETKRLTPEADIDAAHATNWESLPDGEIKHSTKIKKSRGAHALPAKRVVVAANDNLPQSHVIRTESLHMKVTDEVLNAQIDAKPTLAELRYALGPLVEPFEDVALGGKTYTDVGRLTGEKTQPAVAGRAIIGTAIGTIMVKWQEIDKREKQLEADALRRFRNRAA